MEYEFGRWSLVVLPGMLDAAVKGVLVLALAALVVAGMRRGSAAGRHWVWFLGVVSLLVLPVLSAGLPGWQVLPGWGMDTSASVPEPAALRVVPMAGVGPTAVAPAASGSGVSPPVEMAAPAAFAASPMARAAAPIHLAWQRWVLLVWLGGSVVLLGRVGLGHVSLWWLERRAERITAGEWAGLLRELCERLGMRGRVELLASGRRAMPMTWGVWRTRVLLPGDCELWTVEQRRAVLLHELAHAKRRDCVTQLVVEIARALHWFNPLVWVAGQRMQAERERACDDLVLGSGTKPSAYAEQLLQIAAEMPMVRLSAAAIAMARPSKLEGRVRAILDGGVNRRGLTRWGVLAAAVVALGLAVPMACVKSGEADSTGSAATRAATSSSAGHVLCWRVVIQTEETLPGTKEAVTRQWFSRWVFAPVSATDEVDSAIDLPHGTQFTLQGKANVAGKSVRDLEMTFKLKYADWLANWAKFQTDAATMDTRMRDSNHDFGLTGSVTADEDNRRGWYATINERGYEDSTTGYKARISVKLGGGFDLELPASGAATSQTAISEEQAVSNLLDVLKQKMPADFAMAEPVTGKLNWWYWKPSDWTGVQLHLLPRKLVGVDHKPGRNDFFVWVLDKGYAGQPLARSEWNGAAGGAPEEFATWRGRRVLVFGSGRDSVWKTFEADLKAALEASEGPVTEVATGPAGRGIDGGHVFLAVDKSWRVEEHWLRELAGSEGYTMYGPGEKKPWDVKELRYYQGESKEPRKIVWHSQEGAVAVEMDNTIGDMGTVVEQYGRRMDGAGKLIDFWHIHGGTQDEVALGPDGARREMKAGHGMVWVGTKERSRQSWFDGGVPLAVKTYAGDKCERVRLDADGWCMIFEGGKEELISFVGNGEHWKLVAGGKPEKYANAGDLGGIGWRIDGGARAEDVLAAYQSKRAAFVAAFLKGVKAAGWEVKEMGLPGYVVLSEEAATRPAGEAAYVGLYERYKAVVREAVKAGDKEGALRVTDAFAASLKGRLLQVRVSRETGPDKWEQVISKTYGGRFVALPAIKYASYDELHVSPQRDEGVDYILIETGPGKHDLYITMAVAPEGAATRPAATAAATASAAGGSAWRVKLECGATVELVGVTENGAAEKPWWRPDGTPLAAAPAHYPKRSALKLDNPGYDIMILVNDLLWSHQQGDYEILTRIEPKPGHKGGQAAIDSTTWRDMIRPPKDSPEGLMYSDVYVFSQSFADAPEHATIQFGVGGGPWETLARQTVEGQSGQSSSLRGIRGSKLDVSFGAPYVADIDLGMGKMETVYVTVAHNVEADRQVRVVASLVDGKEVFGGVGGAVSDGHVQQITQSFRRGGAAERAMLTVKDIKEIRLEARPFQWVEFKDVPLRAGAGITGAAATATRSK